MIKNLGSGGASSVAPVFSNSVSITGTEPRLILTESDAAANLKKWDVDVNASVFRLRTRTDADGAGSDAIAITRNGLPGPTPANIQSVVLGNATLGSTLTLDFGGGSLISDTDFFFLTGQFSVETLISSIEFISATLIDFSAAGNIAFTTTGASVINFSTGGALRASFAAGGAFVMNSAPVRLAGFTVATLPAGVVGDMAYVTDATAPAYNVALIGGGAVRVKAFFNGTAWVAG